VTARHQHTHRRAPGVVHVGERIDVRARLEQRLRHLHRVLRRSLASLFDAVGAEGPIVNVETGLYDDSDPDVAYDGSSNTYLVVWRRTFGPGSSAVRAQRVSGIGVLIGGLIGLPSTGGVSRPRVATLRTRSRFGVVWVQKSGGMDMVQVATLASHTGLDTPTSVLYSQPTTLRAALAPDIGCETNAAIGSTGGFVTVFKNAGTIWGRRVYFDSADQLIAPPAFVVLPGVPVGNPSNNPSISP
jgi:hypothetical protein